MTRHEGTTGIRECVAILEHDNEFSIIGTSDCLNCAQNLCIEAIAGASPGDKTYVFTQTGFFEATEESIADSKECMEHVATLRPHLAVLSVDLSQVQDADVERLLRSVFGRMAA